MRRSELLSELATVQDYVPAYEASGWFGVGAAAGTPAEIIDKFNEDVNAGLADLKFKAWLAELGGTVLAGSSPAQFGKLIADETARWAKMVKLAGIKAGLDKINNRSSNSLGSHVHT